MSLKAELETWAAALKCYDEENLEQSLEIFSVIADSSKVVTNMGLIYATLGEHEAAVEQFIKATRLDSFLAVAYFQCGVSNFLIGRYENAVKDFDDTLLYMRGNQTINYTQLGLAFVLYSAEVTYNKGLCLIFMKEEQAGMDELHDAATQKVTKDHGVIDEAIQDRGQGYTVFSIPVGVLYRPSEAKLKNAPARDFLGKAKLVAVDNPSEAYTAFTGVTRLKKGITPSGIYVDVDRVIDDSPSGLIRSATAPAPRMPKGPDMDVGVPARGLSRSNTTLAVPSGFRSGSSATSPMSPSSFGGAPPSSFISTAPLVMSRSASLTRKKTSPTARSPSTPLLRAGSARPAPAEKPLPAWTAQQNRTDATMTAFYDSYLDPYFEPTPRTPVAVPLPPPSARTTNASAPLTRAMSAYGGSSRSGTINRRVTRRAAPPPSAYAEEEGYVSGGELFDEGYELTRIRVKIHFGGETRGMALDPEMPYTEFVRRVADKFDATPGALTIKFLDEEGEKVTLRDASDYDLAIETARESADGRPEGKLAIWCEMR